MRTLDNLRKEAKRWLRALQAGDPSARQRLRLIWPGAPAAPGLRDIQHALARERGYESWRALKAAAERRTTSRNGDARPSSGDDAHVDDFLQFATWDHHVHGRGDYAAIESAALRLLAAHPELATANLYTAIVCGEIAEVDRLLAADPGLAATKGGFRNWEPLLYLCYARLPLPNLREHALAIATRLLDRGASPNAYYMAGDAVYSALTGVAGEGEQDAPPHIRRNELYEWLLARGADPYDIQVLYNTHFRGDVLWWLQLTYNSTVAAGRAADWADPDWPMFDMGGYGSGARFLLGIAIEKNDVALARWVLAHGANPDPAPARDPRFSKRSVYQDAVRAGCDEIAALLREHGAPVTALELDDHEAYLAACFRLDRDAMAAAHQRHPEYLASPLALFAAARRDRVDVVAALLDLGVPIEVEDDHHQRVLHIAAGSDARRVAALLIDRGAAIDPRETRYGGTPLGHAHHNDHRAMIDLLAPHSRNVWMLGYCAKIERLANVLRADASGAREVTADGITPLFWLPNDDQQAVTVARLLLSHGADPTQVSTNGRTAADAARKRGLEQAASLLSSAAAARDDGRVSDLDGHDTIARALATAYDTGDPAALARLKDHFGHELTHDDVRANVWRRLRTVREANGAPAAFGVDEARQIVARDAGFGSWEQLAQALQAGAGTPAAYSLDRASRTLVLTRHLTRHDWHGVLAVIKEQQIEALDAHGYMTDEVMAQIAAIPSLTRLELGGSRQLTDEGLQHLRRMPQLQHLDLSEYPGGVITDRGLEPLADLPNLRRFIMTWQRGITDAGVAHLARCGQLERVNLMGTPTGDGAIAALAGKTHLRQLETGRQLTDAGLLRLAEFPAFTTAQDRPFTASLLSFEDGGTQLLIDGPITDRGLAALAPLAGLDGLHIFWHAARLTPDGLRALRNLGGLRALGCSGELCTDVAMAHIAAMPRLRKLMAQGTVATDAGFIALSRSRTLEHLWGRECPNLTGRGFAALAELPALRGLAVSCKQVDDAALARLPHFPALRELLPMDVSDAGFRHIGACVELDHLCCMYCRDTTDDATRHLRGLTKIRRYYAGATQITDASLEILSTLHTLERVEIYECLHVTDAGIRQLATLPRLRELSLSGLPFVTRATVDSLPPSMHIDYHA